MTGRRGSRNSTYRGSGVIGSLTSAAGSVLNKAVDLLPIELHLPNYNYCGPGTKLKKRLERGDKGINKLDEACREHDIAYAKYSDNKNRSIADRILAERAWQRAKASDSSLGEKAAAWAVTNIMKAKTKFGAGSKTVTKKKKTIKKKTPQSKKKKKCTNKTSKKGKGLYLRPYKGSGCGGKKKNTRS